ncbi:MAG: L-ribulose-5-phosphate 3-epimerase [Treponema sp.]|jgi:L-ribulose-5-phosphate 3-epimerase/hexulose-6-phosphate isomerase|nr:L-ribulose-5-phosphate 3-epimerase [Treponema sp.]
MTGTPGTPSYRLGLYEKSMPASISLAGKLEEAAKAGFDYLELSIDETDEKLARLAWKGEAAALRRDAEKTGVPVLTICLSGHRRFPLGDPDPAVRKRSLEITEGAVSLASRLGVRIIQIAGYDVYYSESNEETRKLFGENLRISVETAAREGVMLAFETMETPFIDTVEKAVCWINRVGSPYLQAYPDTGNITNAALIYGMKAEKDLARGAGHLAALHLKESKPGIYREVPYGQGHVDFPALARTALRLGTRLFTGEFWYTGGDAWRDELLKNNGFLRKVLDGAAKPSPAP